MSGKPEDDICVCDLCQRFGWHNLTPYQEIIHMIETVSPNDNEALNKIDCHVEAYLRQVKITRWPHKVTWKSWTKEPYDREYSNMATVDHPGMASITMKPYTRSRDRLKDIRPEGWKTEIKISPGFAAYCSMRRQSHKAAEIGTEKFTYANTEELAELHAIIQAIEYERARK